MVLMVSMCAFGAAFLVFLATCYRHAPHRKGAFLRSLLVAAGLAALATLPLATLEATMAPFQRIGPVGVLFSFDRNLLAILISWCLLFLYASPRLGRQRVGELPLEEDLHVNRRVEELSRLLGIATPLVRSLGSASARLDVNAFACGLAAPTIVVTDGIKHRLAPPERDGVLAHELAHLANGTLWYYAAIFPVSLALGAGAAKSAGSFSAGLFFAVAVAVGAHRVIGRVLELASDRAAGRAVGFETMMTALDKTHAVGAGDQVSTVSLLAHATAIHPHPLIRRDNLARAAGLDGAATCAPIAGTGRHRAAFAVYVWLWATALAAIVFATAAGPERLAAHLFAAGVTIAPFFFHLVHSRSDLVLSLRLSGSHVSWVLAVAAIVLGVWGYLRFLDDPEFSSLALIGGAFLLLIVAVAKNGEPSPLALEIAEHLRDQQPGAAAETYRKASASAQRHPLAMMSAALAVGLLGDSKEAVRMLEGAIALRPKLLLARLNLASILLDVDPERALTLATELKRQLVDQPVPGVVAHRALRRLGRIKEAIEHGERLVAELPKHGLAQAVGAIAAIDAGDRALAESRLAQAEALEPGDAYVAMAHAALARAFESPETAEAALARAEALSAAGPLNFLDPELAELRSSRAKGGGN